MSSKGLKLAIHIPGGFATRVSQFYPEDKAAYPIPPTPTDSRPG
jgi:hypothetical protein